MVVGLDARYGLMRERRGIGVYTYQLLEEWRVHPPADVTFVAFADQRADGALVQRFQGSGITVVRLDAHPFAMWEQWALPRAAQAHGVDLLHAMANVAPLWTAMPMVLTVFDVIEWHRGRDFPGRLAWRHRLSRLYRMNAMAENVKRARHVLTISQHAAEDIIHTLRVPSGKLSIIPLGYATRPEEADPSILIEQQLAPRQYALGFGALDARKNVDMLLELAAQNRLPWPLVLIGFEPHALDRVRSRYGHRSTIHLLGFQTDERVKALLANAAVFLYPSYYEGFGLPVLEAMAAATPVVVAADTASAEVARGQALTVPAGDPKAWELALWHLHDDLSTWRRLSAAGPSVAAHYQWSETARAVLDVYRTACRERRSA